MEIRDVEFMKPTHLTQPELNYELRIRGVVAARLDASAKRKMLRRRMDADRNRDVLYVDPDYDFQNEKEIITETLEILEGLIAEFEGPQTDSSFQRIRSRLIYISNRICRLTIPVVDVDAEVTHAKQDFYAKYLELEANLFEKAENHQQQNGLLNQTLNKTVIPNTPPIITPVKTEIEIIAQKRSNWLAWAGLGLMSVQFGILARLTWWEYSWDIMEPVTYFVTYGTAMAAYAYFVLTKEEYVLNDVRNRQHLIMMHKKAKKTGVDLTKYNQLKAEIYKRENTLKKLRNPLKLHLPKNVTVSNIASDGQPDNNTIEPVPEVKTPSEEKVMGNEAKPTQEKIIKESDVKQ
ncbi:unnamed protein product [Ceutorhynchus assimilis]|uniref:Calcium uniporter protein n=1 Tax=Ceutorhynchus assimilis TaxID=467358 RepID=A0A9N9MTP5_9CUCU|nr:unnamed protein product [Ceutorhynchus assimilis]